MVLFADFSCFCFLEDKLESSPDLVTFCVSDSVFLVLASQMLAAAVNEKHSPALEMLEWLTRSKYPGHPRSQLAMLLHG